MISAIRLDGTTACMNLPGTAYTAAFGTYIGQVLCQTLKQGDFVVMDNLAVYKGPQVAALVQAQGGRGAVPAILLTRPQPNRKNVEQDQV